MPREPLDGMPRPPARLRKLRLLLLQLGAGRGDVQLAREGHEPGGSAGVIGAAPGPGRRWEEPSTPLPQELSDRLPARERVSFEARAHVLDLESDFHADHARAVRALGRHLLGVETGDRRRARVGGVFGGGRQGD